DQCTTNTGGRLVSFASITKLPPVADITDGIRTQSRRGAAAKTKRAGMPGWSQCFGPSRGSNVTIAPTSGPICDISDRLNRQVVRHSVKAIKYDRMVKGPSASPEPSNGWSNS